MPYKTGSIKAAAIFLLLSAVLAVMVIEGAAQNQWAFPDPPPQEEYGNILISRISASNNVKPVIFSHWLHRRKFTCRVCHFEIEFAMKVNATGITEAENQEGKYCGVCHNGKDVFGHTKPNCEKCHTGSKSSGREKFSELANLPTAPYGNGVDWSKAMKKELITPKNFIRIPPAGDITFDKKLLLEAEWKHIPPAVFRHKTHTEWLDCSICHPDIFNIKKKATKHFSMKYILEGQFCGACHLSVAFPMQDCHRCHPAIPRK